ncbi:DUF4232 domain-containing protein [Streptomyces sp. NPDC090025]|uniref:DUF4232 domain-containing protein n=1 Tax=Streptomyces sp. NPDC090025 TaxID=3365922 RepID=UPI0038343819
MRIPARIPLVAASVALAGLALSGCGGSDKAADAGPADGTSTSAAAPATATATASASAQPSGSASASASSGGASASGGSTGGSGDSYDTVACTTKNTSVTFTASAHHASEHQPASAVVKVTNVSKKTCTIVGASTLTAKDDQGKADPVMVDNAENGTDAVDIKPGASVTARVAYTDLNFEGSASAREVCPVQASTIEFALPKDGNATVKVTKADGSAGVFNVCRTGADEVALYGFES